MVDAVRLNVNVEKGALGGPRFQTTVLTGYSGIEQRNIDWSKRRGEWNISWGIQTKADFASIVAMFHACYGRAYSFRFKDWADFESGGYVSIGTGTGALTTFQLVKPYSNGVRTYSRTITKPVSGTVTIKDDGSLVSSSDYEVDYTTGIITFDVAPAAGHAITAQFEFDVPVRFDTDVLSIAMETAQAGSIPSIRIVEVNE